MPKLGKLVGGSEGESERSFGHPFFYPGTRVTEFKVKKIYGARVLPAFNYAIQETDVAGFPLSFVPYRDAAKINPQTGEAAFTAWFFSLKGYRWLGNDGHSFLSPLTGHKKEGRGIDPLFDCFMTARNHSNPAYVALTKKSENSEDYGAVLPSPRRFSAFNVAIDVENQLENQIGLQTGKGFDEFKADLALPRPASVKDIVDPEWPDSLYGDITCPYNGLWAVVKAKPYNDANMQTACFFFSDNPKGRYPLKGLQKYPIDPNDATGQAILAGRFDIANTETVTRIPTAEEVLAIIVSDGFLPYDLIVEACSHHWTVPADTSTRHISTAPPEDEEGGGAFNKPSAAPPDVEPVKPAVLLRPPVAPPAKPVTAPPAAARPPVKPAVTAAAPVAAARLPAAAAPPRLGTAPPAAPPRLAVASPATPPRLGTAPPARAAAPPARPAVRPIPRAVAPPVPAAPVEEAPSQDPVEVPVAEAAPAEAVLTLTQDELAAFKDYSNRFQEDPNGLTAEEMIYFTGLSDRLAATSGVQ